MSLLTKLKGTGVALITPFKDDCSIDWDSLANVIEHVLTGGVEFIVCLGTTGEAITLSSKECQDILQFTIQKVNQRVPIIAGFFGSNNTNTIIDRLKNINLEGVDAILSSSPAYNKPTQEGIYQHYCSIADASPVPIIIYNVPSRTASNVEPATVLRLAKYSKNIIGVKEASGNLMQSMKIIRDKPDNFLVLSGDDPITIGIMAAGGDGVISVIANAYPFEFSEMVRKCLEGNYPAAQFYNNMLLDAHAPLYLEGNPVGVKTTMELMGICGRQVRMPLVKGSDELIAICKEQIEESIAYKKRKAINGATLL
jgi:4-hydroxy-tetrahydrodipicolinate synthase